MAPIPGNNREEPDKDDETSLDTPQFAIQGGSDSDDGEQSGDEDAAYAGYQVSMCFYIQLLYNVCSQELMPNESA